MTRFSLLVLPARFALSSPRIAAVVLLLALAICAVSLTRLAFEDDITKSFASGSVFSQEYEALIDALPSEPTEIIVVAQSSTPFDARDFATLRDVAFELELAEGVGSVYSIASVRFPNTHIAYPGALLLPVQINAGEVGERLDAIQLAGIHSPVSNDRRSTLFSISLDAQEDASSRSDKVDISPVVDTIRNIISAFGGQQISYSLAGESLIGPDMIRALQRDLIAYNIVGGALAFVLALLILGNLKLVAIAVIPAFLAAFVSLSVFSVLDFPITVLNTIMPTLVLVLALADSVHLTLHLRDNDPGNALRIRVAKSIDEIGPACALTALTTSIAFASIAFSENQQLRDMAIIGALSVLLAYLVVLVSFPLLARFVGVSQQIVHRRKWALVSAGMVHWILRKTRFLLASGFAVTMLAIVGLFFLHPWFILDENLPTTSSVRAANQVVAHEFGGFYRIWSELEYSNADEIDTQKGWARLVDLTTAIENAAPDYTVLSLATLSRWWGHADQPPTEQELDELPRDLIAQLVSQNPASARVITRVPEAMLTPATLKTQMAIETAAISANATRTVGIPIIIRHEAVSIIRQLSIGLGIACVISVIVLAVFYQWPILAIVLLLPNLLPLIVTASSLVIFNGGQLTPVAMLALTVAFGIAIDDSIHFVNRYIVERQRGLGSDAALGVSIQETGKAMIATTALICAGMGVTMMSSFETIRMFGGMLILAFIVALFADLLLLPSLLRMRVFQR